MNARVILYCCRGDGAAVLDVQAGLVEANSQADGMREAFLSFVGHVAKSAVNNRTGQPLGTKV
jgi:hypothetical protein